MAAVELVIFPQIAAGTSDLDHSHQWVCLPAMLGASPLPVLSSSGSSRCAVEHRVPSSPATVVQLFRYTGCSRRPGVAAFFWANHKCVLAYGLYRFPLGCYREFLGNIETIEATW